MQGSIRHQMEQKEQETLSKYAMRSAETKGRALFQEKCSIRTEYARDRDRIIHCTAFRRLKHKTQVFFAPIGDHYRTRLTHTFEVAQIARTIARAIALNEDLVEAIALGHDLGHTPFGHAGERVLDKLVSFGFSHSAQSVRVAEKLERHGNGLNLTYEVKDGMAHHSSHGDDACTLEGKVVEYADKIAYLNHDIDDAIRGNILKEQDIPKECMSVLGNTKTKRITTMIHAIIHCSKDQNYIALPNDIREAHETLRAFMFKQVYNHKIAIKEEPKVVVLLTGLFDYFTKKPKKLPDFFYHQITEQNDVERAVCDYIAGMSDYFAIELYKDLFIPKNFILKDV